MGNFDFDKIPPMERRKLFEMAKANQVTPEEMAAHIIRLWFVLQDCANGKPTVDVILPVSKNTHTIKLAPDALSTRPDTSPRAPEYLTRYGP